MLPSQEASSDAPFPRWPLAALASGFFVLGVAALSVIALADPMARDLGVSPGAVAHLITVFALAYALAAPTLQVLFRGFQPKRLILFGLLLIAGGAGLGAAAPDYWLLLASRLFMGFGAALVGPLVSAIAGAMVGPGQRGRALAAVFAGMTLATVLGLPLASWLGLTVGWRAATLLIGLAALVAALCIWRGVRPGHDIEGPTLAVLLGTLRDRPLMVAILVTLLLICAQFVTYALLAAFLAERYAAPAELLPLALLLFGVGGVVGNAIGGWWSDRARPETVVLGILMLVGLSFVLLAAAPGVPAVGLALCTVWAVAGLMFQAPQQKRLIIQSPSAPGLVLALNASAIYLGMSLGSTLAGWSARALGFAALPLVSLAVVLLAIMASGLAMRMRRRAG